MVLTIDSDAACDDDSSYVVPRRRRNSTQNVLSHFESLDTFRQTGCESETIAEAARDLGSAGRKIAGSSKALDFKAKWRTAMKTTRAFRLSKEVACDSLPTEEPPLLPAVACGALPVTDPAATTASCVKSKVALDPIFTFSMLHARHTKASREPRRDSNVAAARWSSISTPASARNAAATDPEVSLRRSYLQPSPQSCRSGGAATQRPYGTQQLRRGSITRSSSRGGAHGGAAGDALDNFMSGALTPCPLDMFATRGGSLVHTDPRAAAAVPTPLSIDRRVPDASLETVFEAARRSLVNVVL